MTCHALALNSGCPGNMHDCFPQYHPLDQKLVVPNNTDSEIRMVDGIGNLAIFYNIRLLYWICGKMGVWVDTRSDDGVAVAWQVFFFMFYVIFLENTCILMFF